jgi:hypothetical protein
MGIIFFENRTFCAVISKLENLLPEGEFFTDFELRAS